MTNRSLSGLAKPLLVLIAGPYQTGTQGDPGTISANRARLESFALPIYRRGHLPMVSEWLALPIVRAAGESRGADLDVARARELGLPVYSDVSDLPQRPSTCQ
jgi:hypothetical protein